MTVVITLPDGKQVEYPKGTRPIEVAEGISHGLARRVLSVAVNGKITELSTPINENVNLQFYTFDDDLGKKAFWHSSAHVLAQALQKLYPNVKLTIGPAIETGFYYDVDTQEKVLTESDFSKIEAKCLELAQKKSDFKMTNVAKKEAVDYYSNIDPNDYKLELVENLEDGTITFCTHDDFTDLCRGGHILNTGVIKAFKVTAISGAYWRGDEKNKQITRVYGISFPKQKKLEEHLNMLEEAKKYDHRKLGKELGLFTFSDKVGSGLPLWLPKGADLRTRLEFFMKKIQSNAGYEFVYTPHIGHKDLYEASGHYEKYGEDSFRPIETPHEGEIFMLKPMNCPHHCEIYKAGLHSYRDLPIRYAEFGTVYRYEKSGELHGLLRVRGFTQDDAHIFCTPEQVEQEFENVIDIVTYVLKSLDFHDFTAQISLRDLDDLTKYIGTDENWNKAEEAIVQSAKAKGLKTVVEYGEAAFYGPKLDFIVKDALGRKWQLGTIQVDYNLPERFDLKYKDSDNQKKRPVMIHRAPFGSIERFVAVLLEHSKGNLPLWLAPIQVKVIPVSDLFNNDAQKIVQSLKKYEIRVVLDERNEKVGKKIRDAEVDKTPYMIIIGEKEIANKNIALRRHGEGDIGTYKLEEFIEMVREKVKEYKI